MYPSNYFVFLGESLSVSFNPFSAVGLIVSHLLSMDR
jgi:hypothetical protein